MVSTDFNSRTTTTSWLSNPQPLLLTMPAAMWTPELLSQQGRYNFPLDSHKLSGTLLQELLLLCQLLFCATDSFNLSISGVNSGFGITYQWISSTNGTAYSYIAGQPLIPIEMFRPLRLFIVALFYPCTVKRTKRYFTAVQILLNSGVSVITTTSQQLQLILLQIRLPMRNFAGINNTTTCGTQWI